MKYLQEQLFQNKGKIVWLASYPKSGNTWFRCFLSALITGSIDLAKLKTDGIFSSRQVFDEITGFDSRVLTDKEVNLMTNAVYSEKVKYAKQLMFIKIHDAYTINKAKLPIIPSGDTLRVIYLMRNPLDIVASFAHHNATSIDNTIKLMNNKEGYLAGPGEGLNINQQFRQLLMDWSGHVKSWTEQKNVKVTLIKYEDMLLKPEETFTTAIESMGLKISKTAIKKAITMSSFKKLSSKEKVAGFKEKNIKSSSFFRSGKSNSYLNELNQEQIEKITFFHKKLMKKYEYL